MAQPPKRQLAPKHVEERLKLGASGLQASAITLFAGVVLAPLLNTSLVTQPWATILAALSSGLAELAAFKLLAYTPVAKDQQP